MKRIIIISMATISLMAFKPLQHQNSNEYVNECAYESVQNRYRGSRFSFSLPLYTSSVCDVCKEFVDAWHKNKKGSIWTGYGVCEELTEEK